MTHWHKVLPGRILDVRYEELLAHQEDVSRRILKHIRLPWDERVLAFWQKKRAVHTHSMQQVRQPLYNSAIGSAERYRTQLEPLRAMLGELAQEDDVMRAAIADIQAKTLAQKLVIETAPPPPAATPAAEASPAPTAPAPPAPPDTPGSCAL